MLEKQTTWNMYCD